jgi:hypothetical protein
MIETNIRLSRRADGDTAMSVRLGRVGLGGGRALGYGRPAHVQRSLAGGSFWLPAMTTDMALRLPGLPLSAPERRLGIARRTEQYPLGKDESARRRSTPVWKLPASIRRTAKQVAKARTRPRGAVHGSRRGLRQLLNFRPGLYFKKGRWPSGHTGNATPLRSLQCLGWAG